MFTKNLKAMTCFGLVMTALLVFNGRVNICAAASISYGNFGPIPPGVTFADITESSGTDPVPLFGPPSTFTDGSTTAGVDFDPNSFVATANGGAIDITDGQLNLAIATASNLGISSINLFEAGDYTLTGVGTAATQSLAGAILRAAVTQINGVDIAPLQLSPVNASVGFNLLANPGVVQPWSLGLSLNIAGQLDPGQFATRVEVVIDNQLLALSELASAAFMAKKEFTLEVETQVRPNPEPSTFMLVLSGAVLFGAMRRRNAF